MRLTRPGERNRWEAARKHLSPPFGDVRAIAVTAERIDDHVDARKREGANSPTVNRELAALSQLAHIQTLRIGPE
jgi:hypothetical protein